MKKLLFSLAFVATFYLSQAQTYFGQASTPADNGVNATSIVTVTPPAAMLEGDLVIMVSQSRTAGSDQILDNTGGQTWTTVNTRMQASTLTGRIFWCRYNGTWAADPSVVFNSGVCTSVSMHVFRPGAASNTWMIDSDPAWATYGAPTSPFTVTRPGQTTVGDDVVAFAVIMSVDDNTWVEVPSDWELSGVQYRNTAGSDQSHVVGYRILPTAGTASTDFSCRQSSLGGDSGAHAIVLFREVSITNRGFFRKN